MLAKVCLSTSASSFALMIRAAVIETSICESPLLLLAIRGKVPCSALIAADLASDRTSSNSASADHIRSTRRSPKAVMLEDWMEAEDDGSLSRTDCMKATNESSLSTFWGVHVERVDAIRAWYTVVRRSFEAGSRRVQWEEVTISRLE